MCRLHSRIPIRQRPTYKKAESSESRQEAAPPLYIALGRNTKRVLKNKKRKDSDDRKLCWTYNADANARRPSFSLCCHEDRQGSESRNKGGLQGGNRASRLISGYDCARGAGRVDLATALSTLARMRRHGEAQTQITDAIDLVGLLRPRRQGPAQCRAARKGDEFSTPHGLPILEQSNCPTAATT